MSHEEQAEANPVAVVTAASRGMGAAIARRLADDGWRLALMARSEDVEALADELGAIAVRGSVTDVADLARLVDAAAGRYGRLDGVVFNTGHPPKGDLLEIADDDWHAGLDLAVMGALRLARLAVPHMERQGGGAFVNISTFGAVEPSLDFPVSSVLRASLGAIAQLMTSRYAASGIRMNNVLPGFIDSYAIDEATRARIPAGRAGDVAEIAATVAFLLGPGSAYIAGQSLRVDGGLTRSV